MRGINLNIRTGSVDGFLHAEDPSDPLASQWLDDVRLTGKAAETTCASTTLLLSLINSSLTERHLKDCQAAEFDHMNSRSLDMTFSSKLLLIPK